MKVCNKIGVLLRIVKSTTLSQFLISDSWTDRCLCDSVVLVGTGRRRGSREDLKAGIADPCTVTEDAKSKGSPCGDRSWNGPGVTS